MSKDMSASIEAAQRWEAALGALTDAVVTAASSMRDLAAQVGEHNRQLRVERTVRGY